MCDYPSVDLVVIWQEIRTMWDAIEAHSWLADETGHPFFAMMNRLLSAWGPMTWPDLTEEEFVDSVTNLGLSFRQEGQQDVIARIAPGPGGKTEALELLWIAIEGDQISVLRKVRDAKESGSFNDLRGWLGHRLMKEVFPERIVNPVEEYHKAVAACLEELILLSGRAVPDTATAAILHASLRRAIRSTPEMQEDPFAGGQTFELCDISGESRHETVIKIAKKRLERLKSLLESPMTHCQILSSLIIDVRRDVAIDSSRLRYELETEWQQWNAKQIVGKQKEKVPSTNRERPSALNLTREKRKRGRPAYGEQTSQEADSDSSTGDSNELHQKSITTPTARMSKDDANKIAMRLAKTDGSFVHKTQREWADAIGCSAGLITYLPFWREVAKETGRARRGKAPRVVSLTQKVLAVTADPHAELVRLVSEQEADAEPSPLETDPADRRPRKVKTSKKK